MNLIELAMGDLGVTEADMQNGFKDVEAQLQDGSKRTVRLAAIAESLREPLLRRYATTGDTRTLVRPMLAGEFASDVFLDSLAPWSLALLANTGAALLLGVEQIRKMANHGAQIASQEAASEPPTGN